MPLTLVERAASGFATKPTDIVRGPACRLPWAWDGLCFAVPFHQATAEGARDIVNNASVAVLLDQEWSRDSRGNPSMFIGTTGWAKWTDHPVHDKPSTELTACVRFRKNPGETPVDWSGVFGSKYSLSDPWMSWAITDVSPAGGFLTGSLAVSGTYYDLGSSTPAVPTDQYVTAVLRWRSGEAPRLDVFDERGQLLSSVVRGSAVSGSLSYASNPNDKIRLNVNEASARFTAYYSQAMLWKRKLSDAELSQLALDPFGWYAPSRQTVGVSGPFPIIYATVFRVYGYAMFATSSERDGLQAELQGWLDQYTSADVWPSAFAIDVDGADYTLPGGFDAPDLMTVEDTPTGPWPGLTWSYEVHSKELRDSFGAVPGLGSVWSSGALEGSTFGEATD